MLEYFIGAGDIKVAKLDVNYNPLEFRDVGEAPVFEFDPTIDFADNWATNKTSPNLQDLHIPIKNSNLVHLTLKERTAKNFELEVWGVSTPQASGNYTANEPFPDAIIAGQTYLIPGNHQGITNLVIKDSAVTPATVDPADYTVNPDGPFVTFIDVTPYTQPFKAFSYDFEASDVITILEKPSPELCVIFDGKNLAVPGEKIWCRLDRVAFGPAAKVSMKSGGAGGTGNEVAMYELTGPALVVPGKSSYGDYRRF